MLAFLTSAALAPLFAQTVPTPASNKDEPVKLDKFVTIGSRFNDRSVIDSPVPIDVISGLDLQLNGYTEMGETLAVTVPSIDFPRPANTDGTDTVRPAALRGLSPDQTLVLLNGKRFHASALVNLNGSVGRGSAAVDLNAVPSFALDGAEVLRDGAAAQYGSDAIAGVINLPLRRDIGYSLTSTGGQFYNHDGATFGVSANYGDKLGDKGGFVNVTGYFKNRGYTARSGPDLRQEYFGTNAAGALIAPGTTIGVINGTPDPREATFKRSQVIFGDPVSHERGFFLNSELPLDNGVMAYAFGGMSRRESHSFASWRRPADSTDVRAIYPDGFQPQINPHITDAALTAGAKGDLGGWKWDLSDTWGRNTIDYYTINSVNVTYGAASQTRFYDGQLGFQQQTVNLDLTRQLDVGLSSPLKTAAGLEYRWDNYRIKQGDHASWDNGGVLVLDGPSKGTVPAFGAQGFPGFRPTDETDATRDNVAGYVDFENQVTKQWMIDIAGRTERYSDSGSTVTGKLATRYELTPWLAARASFSNGFRAPALQQATFTTTSSVILTVNGLPAAPYDVKTFQVASPAAIALGATPLKPEKSTNFSGGFTLSPFKNFTASIDYYNIAITDKIVLSSNFATTSVASFLIAQGYPGVEGGRYFTNAVNSRTQGLDVTTRYTRRLADGDRLTLTGGFNYNDTVVTFIKNTPANVLALTGGTPIFDRQSTLRYERGTPLDKAVFSATYDLGARFSFLVRENWYGKVLSAGTTAPTDQYLAAKFVTDAEVSWHVRPDLTVALGANNVFNTYPDKFNAANNTSGLAQYSSFSPFGFNGGFYYGRLNYKF